MINKKQEERLKNKGWTKEELSHAKNVLKGASAKKTKYHKFFEESLYWFILLLVVVGILGGAFALQLILLIVKSQLLTILLLSIFGVLFGSISAMLIKDLEGLEPKHHFILSLVVVTMAFGSFFLMATTFMNVSDYVDFVSTHSTFLISSVFTIAFLIPYFIIHIVRKKNEH